MLEPLREPRSIAILSGSIGRGHDSVAEACRSTLERVGVVAPVLDCMSLLGGAGSRVGAAAFRHLLEVPAVYDGFHFSSLRNGTLVPRALERAATSRLVPALERALAGSPASRLLLSVFPTGVAAAAALKRSDPTLTSVVVCTDACAHRMWVADGTDLYVVCSPVAALTVRRYDPRAAVAVVPPPVRPAFYEPPPRRVARETLGVPAGAPCVLVMSGAWGLGPIAETARQLGFAGYWVLAVAGGNERLRDRLEAVARRFPRVLPFGMTDRVPELMAAADVVVTAPGQTCHEVRTVGRSLVLLDVVPGHGRENLLHELEQGGALACSPAPVAVRAAVDAAFEDHPEPVPWPVRSAAEWDKHLLGALADAGFSPGEGSRGVSGAS